jgi:hypothetical protein
MKGKTKYLSKKDWLTLEKSLQKAIEISKNGRYLTQKLRKEWTKKGSLDGITFRGDIFVIEPEELWDQ